ncbi:MAG TPA: preprotein translocase subunit YajC [Puia sp.]|jgi:preprotein translocase subunit YajC|nr:preprotein translocase subunit YajC [Puia sp.]
MTHLVVLLQAGGTPGNSYSLILLGGMILVFWLFMIRPQAKKAKLAKKFQEDMQKGDKIVTIAGIHGTVNKVNDDGTLMIETSPGSYLKIEKSAISMEWTQNINKPAVVATDKK